MNQNLESKITAAVMKALQENAEFYNVGVPKPTKASTSTQGAWNIDKTPKASSATQGAWDSTDTPGGLASRTKKVWTKSDIENAALAVQKALENIMFYNRPIEGEVKPAANKMTSGTLLDTSKVSASTMPAYKDADPESKKKISASVCAQILTNVYKLDI